MVLDPAAGAVLSIADEKTAALRGARNLLRVEACRSADAAREAGQFELWPADLVAPIQPSPRAKPVSRRRREIFQKCAGCCHYCARPLELAGSWHIEHMLPRALGGADEISNLVAACIPCNLSKSDRTAIEFVLEAKGGR
ncbi:HNH endonuclease [Piscinibacter koreensis]